MEMKISVNFNFAIFLDFSIFHFFDPVGALLRWPRQRSLRTLNRECDHRGFPQQTFLYIVNHPLSSKSTFTQTWIPEPGPEGIQQRGNPYRGLFAGMFTPNHAAASPGNCMPSPSGCRTLLAGRCRRCG